MKHNFRGRRAVLEGVVQTLRRQEPDSDILKFPLFDWHVIHVLKRALTRCGREETKRPQATHGGVTHKLQR